MERQFDNRSPTSKVQSLVFSNQRPLSEQTAKDDDLHPANIQNFRNPGFRHEGCPPHPEYCRNRNATVEIPLSPKALKRGQVARGHRFSMAQASARNVRWLLRHSSCSNAEILHRAWRHRIASRKDAPLRDGEGKPEYLSRWYPQWLTRIAAELDDTRAAGGWIKGEKKSRRDRARMKRSESQK